MELNKDTAKLICELEYLIGDSCYNPNSYNGWTGEEGCSFRYPVHVRKDENSTMTKVSGSIMYYFNSYTPEMVRTMKYKFGSNHLFIGLALKKVLEFLEQRYGLNFAELERERASVTSE